VATLPVVFVLIVFTPRGAVLGILAVTNFTPRGAIIFAYF
jgi:hypothetical protein